MFRTATVAGLVLAMLALSAFADKDDDKKDKDKDKPKAKVYKTPQDVFDAIVVAFDKDDYKTVAQCLAPVAQKDFAGVLGVAFGAGRADLEESTDEEVKKIVKSFKPVYEVLDKHGVTAKALKDVKQGKDKKELEKGKKIVAGLVKDPEAFIVEVLTAMDKTGLGGEKPKTKEELKDLKIDGDKAKGTLVRTITTKDKKEKVKKEPVEFVKINDSWRVIPTFDPEDEEEVKPKDKDEKKDK